MDDLTLKTHLLELTKTHQKRTDVENTTNLKEVNQLLLRTNSKSYDFMELCKENVSKHSNKSISHTTNSSIKPGKLVLSLC